MPRRCAAGSPDSALEYDGCPHPEEAQLDLCAGVKTGDHAVWSWHIRLGHQRHGSCQMPRDMQLLRLC